MAEDTSTNEATSMSVSKGFLSDPGYVLGTRMWGIRQVYDYRSFKINGEKDCALAIRLDRADFSEPIYCVGEGFSQWSRLKSEYVGGLGRLDVLMTG